ncbi:metal-sensitive transcriptional regulator [Demequina sp. TTPB684]|uniref:metal-sensitive transcriptional regulator n=1 Tax=unclassified Demequina TaxID=2620311 RepID=UPI001CF5C047|nr:metal-sensitive transcriptional regulator [Demequina sp. TMPB413]MCB2411553.1 metal-sensitive transcriptional regulator [Demequina sp. TTPB684]UPU87830.1 metal-sensitive transcriptional regulator [Demequina sp. TMPB413]
MTEIYDYQRQVINRLKTARGHLGGIIRMIEDDAWCPDVMKQLAAVQGMLEGTSREVFRHHLEGHVATAIRAGRGEEIVDELMETLKYDKRVLRPAPADVNVSEHAAELAVADADRSVPAVRDQGGLKSCLV